MSKTPRQSKTITATTQGELPLMLPGPEHAVALEGSVTLGSLSVRVLTAAEFQGLADVPPELEWFANIANAKTRRAYQQDVKDFTAFVGMGAVQDTCKKLSQAL